MNRFDWGVACLISATLIVFLPLRQGNSDLNNVTILGCIFIFFKETWVITRGNRSLLTARIRHVTRPPLLEKTAQPSHSSAA